VEALRTWIGRKASSPAAKSRTLENRIKIPAPNNAGFMLRPTVPGWEGLAFRENRIVIANLLREEPRGTSILGTKGA